MIEPAQRFVPVVARYGEDWSKTARNGRHRSRPLPSHRHRSPPLRLSPLRRGCCAGGHANWLIEGGLPTEGTLAHVAVSKYADHLPLYRQCQIYGRGGVDLDRSTLANWCGVAAYHWLRSLIGCWSTQTIGRLFMDENRAPVLDPKAGKTKTGLPLGGDPR